MLSLVASFILGALISLPLSNKSRLTIKKRLEGYERQLTHDIAVLSERVDKIKQTIRALNAELELHRRYNPDSQEAVIDWTDQKSHLMRDLEEQETLLERIYERKLTSEGTRSGILEALGDL